MSKSQNKRKHVTLDFWNSSADVGNAFKTLFANIRFAAVDKEIKSLVVVGSGVSEGKTMVSVNLANAIASAGHRVLLIEGDMRKHSLGGILNIKPEYGIFNILTGGCTIEQACVETHVENLYFLDCENQIPSPPDILSTDRFASLVDILQDKYDYVIFDTPPLSSFVDAALISNLVDGTIICVRQGKAKKTEVAEIVKQLRTANANILGSILTFSKDASEKDYYYAYYNKDHERVNKEDFKPREDISEEEVQSNLDSWLNKSTSGRAQERRDAMSVTSSKKVRDSIKESSKNNALDVDDGIDTFRDEDNLDQNNFIDDYDYSKLGKHAN